jgi:hypothetical protein
MNDSRNFGADFHCDPNSIITLNEKLPQPRVGIASTASVGLGYTDALRADPYAANLVLAIPGVIGGQGSGYGDYSANIKGSGSNKTVTANGNAGVALTASYYGSALSFDGSGDYFTIPNNSDFYFNGDFTVEFWVYRNVTSTSETLVGVFENSVARRSWQIETRTSSALRFEWFSDGSSSSNITSANNSVPGGQWNHIAMVKNNNTIIGYVNGVSVGINTNAGAIYQNTVDPLRIGVLNAAEDQDFNGYLQDLRIYKGVAKYTGGFDVLRPYTPVGIATWRQVPDTTANNFATMNPLIEARPSSGTNSPSNSTIITFADGNLNLSNAASSGNAQRMVSFATIGISTGKWYYEEIAGTNSRIGLSKGFQQLNYSTSLGGGSGLEASLVYETTGVISFANTSYYSTATTLSPPTFNNTNIIGVAIDASLGENNLTVRFYKDGVGVSTLTGVGATSPVREWFPTKTMLSSGSGDQVYFNFGQNPTFSGNTTAGTFTDTNGKGLFKYQPPSGFLALCEDNLPTPAISDPGKYFKTVLWTGDGSLSRSIVGVGFTPDMVWVKTRNAINWNYITDSVRGIPYKLYTNSTNAEDTAPIYGKLNSFGADGFTAGAGSDSVSPVSDSNGSGTNYVAWCWRAGAGTTSTNTNGSITSVVSVNQEAGFSIVSFTGTGAQGTFGHGLGKTPKFIVMKRRTGGTNNWSVYHSSLGLSHTTYPNWLYLSATSSEQSSVSSANHPLYQRPDSSLIYLNTGTSESTNVSGSTYIAYCWAEIEGFSKFGSWVSNANADGPFIYCGFKPALVICKTASGDVSNWVIADSSRSSVNDGATSSLRANTADTEATSAGGFIIDFLSNGFKVRQSGALNSTGLTNIFAAWAESPFQTANSK